MLLRTSLFLSTLSAMIIKTLHRCGLGAFLLFLSASLVLAQGSFTDKTVGISDGDTIQVMHEGKPEKIRLAEIDCPEKRQAFGTKAKQFTSRLVGGQVVTVQVRTKDRYGRTVGEVFLEDGRSLNRELVKAGYAWWYKKYSDDESLGQLELEAKEAKRGLWSDPNAVAPWDFRRGKGSSQTSRKTTIASASGVYHGNLKSQVFHAPSCRYYNCQNCGTVFSSRSEAISAGYRPCGMCSP